MSAEAFAPAPTPLMIERFDAPDKVRLMLHGELDMASMTVLQNELRGAGAGARIIELDLAGLEFIDSSGLFVLVEAHRQLASNGQILMLKRVPAQALRLFKLSGAITRLNIQDLHSPF